MKYRQFETSFWEDGYILELNRIEKLLFNYLFTNSKVNMCGIYELPDRIILSTLGPTLDELGFAKAKFEKDKKYSFHKGWVFINNFAEHNTYSPAPNVLQTYIKDFNHIPSDIKDYFINKLKLSYSIPIANAEKHIVMDMVRVMVMVKDGTPYPTPYPRNEAKEDINPDSIPL